MKLQGAQFRVSTKVIVHCKYANPSNLNSSCRGASADTLALIAEGVARQQQPAKAKRITSMPAMVIRGATAAHGTMAEADPLLDVHRTLPAAPTACLSNNFNSTIRICRALIQRLINTCKPQVH